MLPWLWLVLALLAAWHAYRWPPRAYRHTSYRIDEQGIEIRKGVYWRVVINVPRSRVQHIDVSQGPIERRYGLGTLVIYTAGTDHAKVELDGLEHGRALAHPRASAAIGVERCRLSSGCIRRRCCSTWRSTPRTSRCRRCW